MTTHPEQVATPQSPTLPDTRKRGAASTAVLELQVTVLEQRIAALERELDAERQKRQAVVDRYERLLADR